MRNTRYLRFAALGDSTTCGIGTPFPAVSGATSPSVHELQLDAALSHRSDLASLIVGVNDTMRSTWDPVRLRADLMECADALHGQGALLLTARFHDHGAVFGLPGVLRRPLFARIEEVNRVYDEIHATYGGIRLDLATRQEVWLRGFWSVDRLHPSELGHRALARAYGELLLADGLVFELPNLDVSGGFEPSWRRDLSWMVAQGAPWFGRRARDLGPWAVRLALTEGRPSR